MQWSRVNLALCWTSTRCAEFTAIGNFRHDKWFHREQVKWDPGVLDVIRWYIVLSFLGCPTGALLLAVLYDNVALWSGSAFDVHDASRVSNALDFRFGESFIAHMRYLIAQKQLRTNSITKLTWSVWHNYEFHSCYRTPYRGNTCLFSSLLKTFMNDRSFCDLERNGKIEDKRVLYQEVGRQIAKGAAERNKAEKFHERTKLRPEQQILASCEQKIKTMRRKKAQNKTFSELH